MRWMTILTTVSILSATTLVSTAPARYPQPAIAPTAWELDFSSETPRRIVVEVPGESVPRAYWYMTYVVTNNTGAEQFYLPRFEMVAKDGSVIPSDTELSGSVFQAVARKERQKPLVSSLKLAGQILQGQDQAKYGVAIWQESAVEMGNFSVFVHNLSGEATPLTDSKGETLKDAAGQPIVLRKTKQIDFVVAGDEVYSGDPIRKAGESWVMR